MGSCLDSEEVSMEDREERGVERGVFVALSEPEGGMARQDRGTRGVFFWEMELV